MMTNSTKMFSCAAITVALGVAPAIAGEPDIFIPAGDPPAGDEWEFTVNPYFWFAGLDGDIGVAGVVSEVDMDFGDIWDALDFGLMGSFEARKGKWGVNVDALWLKLKEDGDLPVPGSSAEVEVNEARLQAMLTYRVTEGRTTLDLGAGVAWFYLGLDLDFSPAERPGFGTDGSKDFFDPMIGYQLSHQLSEKWFLGSRGQIGGFGVSSDLTWQLGAYLGYQLSERSSMGIGYRHLYIDYSDGGFLYDADTSGVFLGGAIEF